MEKSSKIVDYVNSIISVISNNINEHKQIEKSKFWKNFQIWTELLYEGKEWWFFEWYFLWHVGDKARSWVYNYYYKILNKMTGNMELCPIYNISWYIDN